MNVSGGILFLFDWAFDVYLYIILARFVLQIARADFYNPVSQFIVKATSPVLIPLRKIIPGVGGIDVASVVMFFLVVMIKIIVIALIVGQNPFVPQLVVAALRTGAGVVINFFLVIVFISVLLSWIAPPGQHPFADILRQMAEPVLAPARRLLPAMGGMDFSPILVFLLLNFLKITFQL